ncbi:MAG TPA: TIR domain-containing protein [Opitutaceae bacterium]|nr:TIR domain-containing protein [Opitutaceae bacterium]
MATESSRAVFLSYASQDAEAARRICGALRAAGVEVWFDQSELVGGDAWDAKIRKQIRECALFVPVISPNTNARAEGYFRREWKQAVERTHDMADDVPFLFPIVIGDVPDATARVPDKFREVQWTRLRLDESPGEVATRVARLLSGEATAVGDAGQGASRPPAGRGASRSRRRPWWIVFPVIGVITGLIYAVRPLWDSFHGGAKPDRPPVAEVLETVAPMSEAAQLAAKARAILNEYDSTANDYAVAEGYIKRALELDPNDGESWAVSSVLNTGFRTRGFDQSRTRIAVARSHAEKALKLAPDSAEALFALGRWQRDNDPDLTIAEKTFLEVLTRAPNHLGALNNLGSVYTRQGRVDEAVRMYRRSAQDTRSTALAGYTEFMLFFRRARFAEADRAIHASLATQPSTNSQAGLAMLLLTWKGDAEAAAKAMSSGPAATRNEHRTIWITAQVHLARRAPEDALQVLKRMSDDFIEDNWFDTPTAYLAGRAHTLAGRTEAARVAWEAALGVVDARLKRAPDNRALHLSRGELLAWLGREAEALSEARTVTELARGTPLWWFTSPLRIYAALGRVDEALPLLHEQLQFTREQRDIGWPLTPALLRLDPLWDKFRGDPRFQALCVEPADEEKKAGPASAPLSEGA